MAVVVGVVCWGLAAELAVGTNRNRCRLFAQQSRSTGRGERRTVEREAGEVVVTLRRRRLLLLLLCVFSLVPRKTCTVLFFMRYSALLAAPVSSPVPAAGAAAVAKPEEARNEVPARQETARQRRRSMW